MAYLPPRHTNAVDSSDMYLIINTTLNRIVESHPSKEQADYFCDNLNKNIYGPFYKVVEK